ncbi:MAG: TauD/TfdA family dioxygenase [Acinetobacter sp.]|uniref:TauD/TfdA dioxygenase family protein n=1 Tax=Acinetobacter sp. TaxID=472 RepID=UPI0025908558|nr:TauD/TfdA family dioxygenase [Acinetobacter sp.]MCE1270656.1 TauD/TfdA family dioxygenase [Acinetobacter sp.]
MSEVLERVEQKIIIKPITGHIGAEISGVKLSGELSFELVNQIYQVLLEHKVIFFRGQQHLSNEEQEKFAALFGEPVKHPTVPTIEGTNYVLELDSKRGERANSWHTDVTFVDAYPKLSVLRGVKIPEYGGDTTWANTESAYEDLPESLKQLADGLRAVHTNDYDYGSITVKSEADAQALERYRKLFAAVVYETEHPLVRVHPETGRRSLLLGHFFKRFVGLNRTESSRLFDIFQDRITRPEHTVRWRWQEGDVAIWDNRATQHLAVNDYGDAHRIVRRVTVHGDVPVGVNGQRGVTIVPANLSESEQTQARQNAVLAD